MRRGLLKLALAALMLVLAPAASAQAWFHIFASANREHHLSFEKAQRQLSSEQETNLIAVLDRLYCGLPHANAQFQLNKTLGEYKREAEASAELVAKMNVAEARYAAAVVGLYERQESVLLFKELEQGPDTLWTISVPRPFELHSVHNALEHSGFIGWTITELPGRLRVELTDSGSKLGASVEELSKQLGGRLESVRGEVTLLGADPPKASAPIFEKEISSYEYYHPTVAFSKRITSGDLARAKGSTCTAYFF